MNKDTLDILTNSKFITVSTASSDGSPWGTPIGLFCFDGENIIFYNDVPNSTHLDNLANNPRVFITIVNYDQPKSRSLHIKTTVEEIKKKNEIEAAKKPIGVKEDQPFEVIYKAKLGEKNENRTHPRHSYYEN